mgnify:CR=1 FL=1
MATTNFFNDLDKGKLVEALFNNNFLAFIGIPFADVTNNQKYREDKIDTVSHGFTVDVKTYSKKGFVIIEEYTNANKEYGKISLGWFDKSKANIIAYVCPITGEMIILRFDGKFKDWYINNKEKYQLKANKVSEKEGMRWQSAFRELPLSDLSGFVSYYKLHSNNGYIIYPQIEITL